jgi:tetratricopeptide (TPR) repeat protein
MKIYFLSALIVLLQLSISNVALGQVQTPQLSPVCEVNQTVGLTEINISYSRPSKRNRVIFGEVVPYNEMWRLGANKNSMITISEEIYFKQDTLPKGTYALFAKPSEDKWELVFYSEYSNWGTPENWEESKVALTLNADVSPLESSVETMCISIENIGTAAASLCITWDQVRVAFPFQLMTQKQVVESIEKVMSGPSASDYYNSAKYYLGEGLDPEQALKWINSAVEIRGKSAYWMTRLQAQIYAELNNYDRAIASANLSMEEAEKAGNTNYVKMNKQSIEAWSKKK